MNDPGPYRTTFSDLAASTTAQDAFFESLITFMMRHNFDGVDIDWEYPAADDRGGVAADYDNYVTLVRRLRERLNQTGKSYGLSITLVSTSNRTAPLDTKFQNILTPFSLPHTGTSEASTSTTSSPTSTGSTS